MTYAELTKKYMLKEISKEEYERRKEELIKSLLDRYEEHMIDEKDFKDRLNIIRD